MFSRKFGVTAIFLALVIFANNAHALTINGKEFSKILSVYSANDFGYWPGPQKFFTFVGNDNYIKADNIHAVTYRDPSLAGINFKSVLAMGTTTAPGTAVNSFLSTDLATGNVTLYGSNNQVLLTATYAEAGNLNATYKAGYAGQLNVKGIFNVTGGLLFNSGLMVGSLYIDIAFDHVWQNKFKDLKTNIGTFTFYKQVGGGITGGNGTTGGNTQIPEPATVTLMATSLLGLLGRKGRKKQS